MITASPHITSFSILMNEPLKNRITSGCVKYTSNDIPDKNSQILLFILNFIANKCTNIANAMQAEQEKRTSQVQNWQ